jgi:hypothetical protein
MTEGGWDVFVSYGHKDAGWVRVPAENLHRAGFDVFSLQGRTYPQVAIQRTSVPRRCRPVVLALLVYAAVSVAHLPR